MRGCEWLVLLVLAPAATATAQQAPPVGPFPQLAVEVDTNVFGIGTPSGRDRRENGFNAFLFGSINSGLYLAPTVSIQSTLHADPAAAVEPAGAVTFLRRQAFFVEQLYLSWQPRSETNLYGGKFNAPFGFGHEYFPGVLPAFRAHEAYLIREQVGVGASQVIASHPTWGEHAINAALFTRDTSVLSNTLLSRGKCCDAGFERYRRSSLTEGGPGNSGRLDNFAIALDGDRLGILPSFTYHAAIVSRAPGKDGGRREWGIALGARYLAQWTPEVGTLVFGEWVRFRNSGGGVADTAPPTFTAAGEEIEGLDVRVAERRQFSTLGAQTRYGQWRATLAWQRDQIKRAPGPVPTANWVELSVGTDIGWGFGLDVGWQYARTPRDDGTRAQSNGAVGRLNFRQNF